MPETQTVEYIRPADIDGEPDEVEEAAIAQLRWFLGLAQKLTTGTVKQIRSSWLSDYMRANPSASPEQIAEAWDESERAGQCARLEGAVNGAERVAGTV